MLSSQLHFCGAVCVPRFTSKLCADSRANCIATASRRSLAPPHHIEVDRKLNGFLFRECAPDKVGFGRFCRANAARAGHGAIKRFARASTVTQYRGTSRPPEHRERQSVKKEVSEKSYSSLLASIPLTTVKGILAPQRDGVVPSLALGSGGPGAFHCDPIPILPPPAQHEQAIAHPCSLMR
jgi:hypothetical protein